MRARPFPFYRILAAAMFLWTFCGAIALARPRTITLKILTDEEFRRSPYWKTRIEHYLKLAAPEFEDKFELRFLVAKYDAWTSNNALRSIDALADDLDARANKEGCDILIAVTGQENLESGYIGYSIYKEGIILVRLSDDTPRAVRTLKHELGHQFGAVHVPDPSSVMDYFVQGDNFDPLNIQAITFNRERRFNIVGFPLSRESQIKAIPVYENICRSITAFIRRAKSENEPITGIVSFARPDGGRDPFYLDDAFLFLAQICLEAKSYDRAIETCRSALDISPDNFEAQNLVAIALRRKGSIDEAIERYKKILEKYPNHARVIYNLGIAYSRKGDLEAARSSYEKAISLKPNFAEAFNNLGETDLRLGNMEEAERMIRRAIALSDEFPLAHSNLAEIHVRKKEFSRAEAEAARAMALNPELPEPHNILGNIHHQRGRIEDAIKEYNQALALDPSYEKATYNLGICSLDQNRNDEAKKYFLKALEMNKNFGEAHSGLGTCLIRENRFDEAIAEFLEAQRLGFRPPKTFINLSFVYLKRRMTDAALAASRKALEIDPASAPAHNNLGMAYVQNGETEKAIGEFRAALAADPAYKEAAVHLADTYLEAGKNEEALAAYIEALKLDPKDGILYNNVAVIHFNKGEYSRSWDYVQKAKAAGFKVHPDFLRELKKRLK